MAQFRGRNAVGRAHEAYLMEKQTQALEKLAIATPTPEQEKAMAEQQAAMMRALWVVNTKTNFALFNCVVSDMEPNSTNFLLLQRGKTLPVAIPLRPAAIGFDVPPFNAYQVFNGFGEFRCYQFRSWRKETNNWDKTP